MIRKVNVRRLTALRNGAVGRNRWDEVPDEAGTAVVESVLVIPILMLIIVVIIQFALWAHASQVVQLAASEGDRAARSSGGGSIVGISQAASVLHGTGSDVQDGTAVFSLLPGDQAQITVSGRAMGIFPGLDLPVTATAVGPVQEFRSSE